MKENQLNRYSYVCAKLFLYIYVCVFCVNLRKYINKYNNKITNMIEMFAKIFFYNKNYFCFKFVLYYLY